MNATPPAVAEWRKPGPGAWTYDGAHNVGPVSPIVQSVFPAAMADGFRSWTGRYGLPISHVDVRYVNDRPYGSVQVAGVPTTDRPPPPDAVMRIVSRIHPVFRRRNRAARRALADRPWRTDLDRWFDELRPARLASIRALQAVDPTVLGDRDLADHVDACLAELAAGFREHFSLTGAAGLPVGLYVLRESERGRHPDETIRSLGGAATGSTAATVPLLADIAGALQRSAVDGWSSLDDVRRASPDAAVALDRYLDEYGQRTIGSFDVTGRRLIELPELIMQSIAAADHQREPLQLAPTSDPIVDDARLAIASRDDHSGICGTWPIGLLRRALLAAGQRLAGSGRLGHADDALACDATEVRALLLGGSGAPTAAEITRRVTRRERVATEVPPPVLGEMHAPPDPAVFPAPMRHLAAGMGMFLGALDAPSGGERDGTGIGSGVYRGRAIVAVEPEDAAMRLRPGDVLVTTTTSPAFNCVLPIAGALVTVHGGPMSHPGIAARELGIPAVVGVAGVLERIVDGETVEVDADRGTIRSAPVHVPFGGGVPSITGEPAVLGGKAAGLMAMARLGLPVPPGVVLPVTFHPTATSDADALERAVRAAIEELEAMTDRRLGDPDRPLLVSVRSGAAVSMPGMMDTLLNVGITPEIRDSLERASGASFADDTERRFRERFGALVGSSPPADPMRQAIEATGAVYRSWDGARAEAFRRREQIADDLGTAVVIQAMVFGNRGASSGSGVVFSRDPSTGARTIVGDLLVSAQGDDVVDGTHRTMPISEMGERWPSVYAELVDALDILEHEAGDMVDVEFTVDDGRLHLLQCRPGRRSPAAACRIAVELAEDPAFAVERPTAVSRCAHLLAAPPRETTPLDPQVVAEHRLTDGVPASPGRGSGMMALSADEAMRLHDAGHDVVLVRQDTSPADVAAMAIARGIVTVSGGVVSHAAVVARSWSIPAVVGAVDIELGTSGITVGGTHVCAGEVITVDGSVGIVLLGAHSGATIEPPALETLRRWSAELHPPSQATSAAPPVDGSALGSGVEPLDAMRIVVLRGRADASATAAALGVDEPLVAAAFVDARQHGSLVQHGDTWVATEAGRALVAAATDAIVARCGPEFAELLERFGEPDRELKHLVTAWQGDAITRAAFVPRLTDAVHVPVTAVLVEAVPLAPHLDRYRRCLDRALARIEHDDDRYIAHPAVDSYHGVWFELHEELMQLAGTSRAAEAAAGRA